jgi:hypothetical protein
VRCDEAQELAGQAIEGTILPEDRNALFRHLSVCSPCRRAFDLELATKHTVRETIPHAPTPPNIRHAILAVIEAEERVAANRLRAARQRTRLLVRTPLVLVGIGMLTFWYAAAVRGPQLIQQREERVEENIIRVAEDNLARVRVGILRPAVVTGEPRDIQEYFRRHGAEFASAIIPPAKGQWYGAVLTEHRGIPMAHLVCKMGEHLMYVFEVQERDVQRDADLRLPTGAIEGIARMGWFSDKGLGGNAVVFWREDQILCAAASTMKPQDMIAVLSAREGR